jgi:hypothetical protein
VRGAGCLPRLVGMPSPSLGPAGQSRDHLDPHTCSRAVKAGRCAAGNQPHGYRRRIRVCESAAASARLTGTPITPLRPAWIVPVPPRRAPRAAGEWRRDDQHAANRRHCHRRRGEHVLRRLTPQLTAPRARPGLPMLAGSLLTTAATASSSSKHTADPRRCLVPGLVPWRRGAPSRAGVPDGGIAGLVGWAVRAARYTRSAALGPVLFRRCHPPAP